ncbi:MAG TPA: amidohydrolase [Fimbriiglobus sp.]|jgi:hippurate hydrolase
MTRARLLIVALPLFGIAGFDPAAAGGPTADVKDRVARIDTKIGAEIADLKALYLHLHQNPELSSHEEKSSTRMAEELKKLGFDVTTHVGGFGVVGVLKNGPGPTVLVRTDMDALPVTEQTGLPYASKIKSRNQVGDPVGVMHACGHDVHMTVWVGTARTLAANKDAWSGTLLFIAQPAEEIGAGARRMLEDGLFKRFPKPDYCLALHCDSLEPVGRIRYTEGLALANVDTVDILVKGKGGHGAAPHTTVDPIVLAARIVLDLQTIVSREVNPTDPAVVTVGSIHGGTKHNVIPNEVKLQLTVRSTKDSVRDQVLKAIERICKAAAVGARAPEPEVKVNLDEYTPATLNDVALTRRVVGVFKQVLGDANVTPRAPIMGGEDFGRYGREGIPIFLYFLGTIPKDRYDAAQKPGGTPLPSLHSDSFAPAPEPSIRTGVKTMSLAVLELLGKQK